MKSMGYDTKNGILKTIRYKQANPSRSMSFQVRGVINLCEEYRGPLKKYGRLGMEELYLPTTDHFEPAVEDLIVSATSFFDVVFHIILTPARYRAQFPLFVDTKHKETAFMFIVELGMAEVLRQSLPGCSTKILLWIQGI
jgi:hypothetical protein